MGKMRKYKNREALPRHTDDYISKRTEEKSHFQDKMYGDKKRLGFDEREAEKPAGNMKVGGDGTFQKNQRSQSLVAAENEVRTIKAEDRAHRAERNTRAERTRAAERTAGSERSMQAATLSQTEKEIYDPLSKDMDNDGTADRYDNDFRDSDISYQSSSAKETKSKIHFERREKPTKANSLEQKKKKRLEKKASRKQARKSKAEGAKEPDSKSKPESKAEPSDNAAYSDKNKRRKLKDRNYSDKRREGKNRLKDKREPEGGVEERKTRLKRKGSERHFGGEKKGIDAEGRPKDSGKNSKDEKTEAGESKLNGKKPEDSKLKEKNPKDSKLKDKTPKDTKEKKKKKSKLRFDNETVRRKSKLGTALGSSMAASAKLHETMGSYLSVGSDNAGVQSGQKAVQANAALSRTMRDYMKRQKDPKKKPAQKREKRLKKKEYRLDFKNNLRELRKSESYSKLSKLKQFQKRKAMKAAIQKKYETRVVDRLRIAFTGAAKALKEQGMRKVKGLALLIVIILALFSFLANVSTTLMSSISGGSTDVLATSYLSSETVLSECDTLFTGMETALQREIDGVKVNKAGYDEYIFDIADIGHKQNEFWAYLTSRCGVIKDSTEVYGIAKELFKKMYDLTYRTVSEKRSYITYDEEGNPKINYYTYKKLYVTLTKKEMDTAVREVFSGYPDNLTHYEALLESNGNLGTTSG